jgi:Zn-dependent protease
MTTWTPTPNYSVGPAPREIHRITTSRTEVLHLLVAGTVLTIAIALVSSQIRLSFAYGQLDLQLILAALPFAITATLTGFVAHEMGHKVAAQRHGFWAEFRFSPVGLLLALVTAAFGFLFAAPGATIVGGMGSTREWGRTSLAGPLVNLVFGGIFATAGFLLLVPASTQAIAYTLLLLAFFNGYFAAFNLIPFGPLDGQIGRAHV